MSLMVSHLRLFDPPPKQPPDNLVAVFLAGVFVGVVSAFLAVAVSRF